MSDQRVSRETEQVSEATTDEAAGDGAVIERDASLLGDATLKEGSVTDLFASDPLSAEELEKLAFQPEGMFEPAEALAGAVDGGFVDAMGEPIDTAGGSIGDFEAFGDAPEGRGDLLDMDLLGTSDMPADRPVGDPTVSGLFGDAVDAAAEAAKNAAKWVHEKVTTPKEDPPPAERELPEGMTPVDTKTKIDPNAPETGDYYDTGDGGGAGITFTEALEQEQLKQDSVINPSNEDDGGGAPMTDENGEPLFIRKSDGYTDPLEEQVDVQLVDPETAILRFNEAGPEYDPTFDEPLGDLDPSSLPPGGWNGGGGDGDGGGAPTPTEG